jgi:hypothetical protein
MNNVWAESETERFTLDMIEKGKENGNWHLRSKDWR